MQHAAVLDHLEAVCPANRGKPLQQPHAVEVQRHRHLGPLVNDDRRIVRQREAARHVRKRGIDKIKRYGASTRRNIARRRTPAPDRAEDT